MGKNLFEGTGAGGADSKTLSHDDMKSILSDAKKCGSFKEAINEYALAHGIEDIELLFPDARNVNDKPEWVKRRTEWVSAFLGAVRKTPFAKIKTQAADLTFEEARAKGYVKGNLKKEEFFKVTHRTTGPTTIYKKQALDRDDIVDITDFDVVSWLQDEMRIMLEEEIARAALLGDSRDISDDDKIDEQCIRPIVSDHEMFTTQLYVNIDDTNSSMMEVVDHLILNRYKLKGSGMPLFYTTEYWIARFLMLKDTTGRRIYKNLDELALELRVSGIIAVEAMMDSPDIVGILVNPMDYTMGTNKGGEVTTFNQFDIDYNKDKYLIETRLSGALTKVKSAMVINRTAAVNVLVVPAKPAFNETTGALTITNQTGVVYKNATTGAVINAAGSPYTVASGTTYTVSATPATGYYFESSDDDSWEFTRP